MLTFFEAWPTFHICAGQGVLFTLTIMGDPQLLFRTLEEPLKCPCWRGMLRCTVKTRWWCIAVRLQSSSALTDWLYSSGTSEARIYKRGYIHRCMRVYSKHTVVLCKPRILHIQCTSMFFQTKKEPLLVKHILTPLSPNKELLHFKASSKTKQKERQTAHRLF